MSKHGVVRGLSFQLWPSANAQSARYNVSSDLTHSRSLHSSQSTSLLEPSESVILELGLVPSRCSSTATIYPLLAISPQNALYMSREQPTPWLNSMSGHCPFPVGCGNSGASLQAGKVVPEIAAAAAGSDESHVSFTVNARGGRGHTCDHSVPHVWCALCHLEESVYCLPEAKATISIRNAGDGAQRTWETKPQAWVSPASHKGRIN